EVEPQVQVSQQTSSQRSTSIQNPEPKPKTPVQKHQKIPDKTSHTNPLSGILVEHGSAPYEHKPDNKSSYYVTLENEGKKSTTWGVDLERAIKESSAIQGDHIELENSGRKPVTINRDVKDKDGNK